MGTAVVGRQSRFKRGWAARLLRFGPGCRSLPKKGHLMRSDSPANISYRVACTLQFDSKTIRIVGEDEANKLLTRPTVHRSLCPRLFS